MARRKTLQPQSAVLATLPLRDMVVYPHMVLPLFVGREKSLAALNTATENDQAVFLLAQKNGNDEDPTVADLYQTGTIANILQVLKLPDGTVKVLVEGVARARVLEIGDNGSHFVAEVAEITEYDTEPTAQEALRRTLLGQFEQFAQLNKKIPAEILSSVSAIEENSRLADTVAAHLQLKLEQRQKLLELDNIAERMEYLLAQIESELDIMQVEKRIRGKVKRQMEKNQRDYYLNEQIKVIQKELGEEDERGELDALEAKIQAAGMSAEGKDKALSELRN